MWPYHFQPTKWPFATAPMQNQKVSKPEYIPKQHTIYIQSKNTRWYNFCTHRKEIMLHKVNMKIISVINTTCNNWSFEKSNNIPRNDIDDQIELWTIYGALSVTFNYDQFWFEVQNTSMRSFTINLRSNLQSHKCFKSWCKIRWQSMRHIVKFEQA